MSRITDALKRADSEKTNFLTKNPGLGFVIGGPEKKGNMGGKVFISFFVIGLVGFLGWVFLGNSADQNSDEVLVGSKDILYSGGESSGTVSSTNPDFSSDEPFRDKLSENYQRQIVSVEETAQERISPEEPIMVTQTSVPAPIPAGSVQAIEPAAATSSSKSNTYVVKTGDNLSKIAGYAHVYGDRNQWKKIFEANKDKLKSPDQLRVGQELLIPTLEKVATSGQAKP